MLRALVPCLFAVVAANDGECDANCADEVAMLQSKVSRHSHSTTMEAKMMSPPFRVCPGSENQCNGNQCCPGIPRSQNKTFPCGNAAAGWNGCEGSLPAVCPEKKTCPGSGNACAGNQCCPGYAGSNGLTFPCPDADSTYVGCESMERQSLAQTTKMEPPFKSEASVLSLPDKDEADAQEEKRKEQEEADAQAEHKK